MKIKMLMILIFLICVSCSSRENKKPSKEIAETFNTVDKYDHFNETYYGVEDIESFMTYLNDNSIRYLGLENGTFSNITQLKELTQLEILEIRYNANITDITPLTEIKNLKCLSIWDIDKLSDITPLSELKDLKNLHLGNCNSLANIDALEGLTNLEFLLLNLKKLIATDGAEFLGLHNITELDIQCANIISMENISKLTTLERLSIDVSNIKDNSIAKLANLNKLIILRLEGVPTFAEVTDANKKYLDFTGFERFKKLEFLTLTAFNIDDVSVLASIPNLMGIQFINCMVSDYTPLIKSKSLNYIRIEPYEWNREEFDLFSSHGIEIGKLENDK